MAVPSIFVVTEDAAMLNELCAGAKTLADRVTAVVFGGEADAQAAAANGVAFVPILPGREADSWRRLQEEALPKLLHGTFGPAYQAELLAALRSALHG